MLMYIFYLLSPVLLILILFTRDVCTGHSEVKTVTRSRKPEDNPLRRDSIKPFHNDVYYQDTFSEHLSPLKIIFGHVRENPQEWEQRYESRNMDEGIYQGKVQWRDQHGNYGEHYWDLNHR